MHRDLQPTNLFVDLWDSLERLSACRFNDESAVPVVTEELLDKHIRRLQANVQPLDMTSHYAHLLIGDDHGAGVGVDTPHEHQRMRPHARTHSKHARTHAHARPRTHARGRKR